MMNTFKKYTSLQAYLAGLSGLAYAYFFVVAKDPFTYNIFLFLSGLFAVKVITALYLRLKETGGGFAHLALIFGVAGAFGTMIHGGFDLANVINVPANLPSDIPNQIDPRGLLTFGSMGLAFFYISWIMQDVKEFPKNLSLLGFVSAIFLIWIYVARLTILDPTNPMLLYPVLLEGFIINPIWYIWVGTVLNKGK